MKPSNLFGQANKKKGSDEYFHNIKPPTTDDLDKESLLFPDSNQEYKPEYLQMPIKLETQSQFVSQRKRLLNLAEMGNDGSMHPCSEGNFQQSEERKEQSEEKYCGDKDECDLLMDYTNKLDMIDAILLPFNEFNEQMMNEDHHYSLFESMEIKREEKNNLIQHQIPCQGSMIQNKPIESSKTQERCKSLLGLLNHFKLYTQASNLCMNFHKLTKKDSLNKVYTSIFNVLNKENKRFFAYLSNEREKLEQHLRYESQGQNTTLNATMELLGNTKQESGPVKAKKEEIEQFQP